jgi:hypothetical protein
VIILPIIEGWEISHDRVEIYEKIMSTDPVGEPILTSKCRLDEKTGSFLVGHVGNGLLVVSENGFAWRIKVGVDITGISHMTKTGKSKWVRWYDIANIIPVKPGQIWVHIKKRKGGVLLDKKGRYRVIKWKLTLIKNKYEQGLHFKQRRALFGNLMIDLFNQKRVEIDSPTSDSRV